jgi:hypothetical protein
MRPLFVLPALFCVIFIISCDTDNNPNGTNHDATYSIVGTWVATDVPMDNMTMDTQIVDFSIDSTFSSVIKKSILRITTSGEYSMSATETTHLHTLSMIQTDPTPQEMEGVMLFSNNGDTAYVDMVAVTMNGSPTDLTVPTQLGNGELGQQNVIPFIRQ